MYQLAVTVHEYPSVWRVHVVFSVLEGPGRVRPLGSNEHWIVVDQPSGDPLIDGLEVTKRAMAIELRPNR